MYVVCADTWLDKDITLACAIKMELWKEFDSTDSPTNFTRAELQEKQLFELSELFYSFSESVNVHIRVISPPYGVAFPLYGVTSPFIT